MVRVMKEFVLPSFPVLTVSSVFAGAPRQLSTIAFIVNDGDAGHCGFPRSKRSAAMIAVVAGVAVGGTECVVCMTAASVVATGGWIPVGYAIAMISSASFCVAAAILSASAGLVIT